MRHRLADSAGPAGADFVNVKILLGTAAVALLATTGAVRAADVMPIVVPVTPVAPVAAGPTVTVQTVHQLYIGSYDQYYFEAGGYSYGEVNVVSASGWGFNLTGNASAGIYRYGNDPLLFGADVDFRAELYRVVGNAEIGFFVAPYGIGPLNLDFGPTFRYRTAQVEFFHETEVSIYGTDWWVDLKNDLTVHVNERLDVGGYLDFEFGVYGPYLDLGANTNIEVNDRLTVEAWTDFGIDGMGLELDFGVNGELDVNDRLTLEGWAAAFLFGGPGFAVGGQATLHLGPISPFVGIEWDGGIGGFGGVELEHRIGSGPYTLIGHAGMNFYPGQSLDYFASIGIRFNLGDVDNLLYTHDDES